MHVSEELLMLLKWQKKWQKKRSREREGAVRQTPRDEGSPLGLHELNWPWRRFESWSPKTHCSLKAWWVGGVVRQVETEEQKGTEVREEKIKVKLVVISWSICKSISQSAAVFPTDWHHSVDRCRGPPPLSVSLYPLQSMCECQERGSALTAPSRRKTRPLRRDWV